jgi:hypothetical protein
MAVAITVVARALTLLTIFGLAAAGLAVGLVKAEDSLQETRTSANPVTAAPHDRGFIYVQIEGSGEAHSSAKPHSSSHANPADRDTAADLAQCIGDWDAATHMTKQEWAGTCKRVVANRAKFIREHGTAPKVPPASLGLR